MVSCIAPVWSTVAALQLGIHLTGLQHGQAKLSARFYESGQRLIATLSARQVMLVLGSFVYFPA